MVVDSNLLREGHSFFIFFKEDLMKEKVKKNPSLSNKIMMLKKPDKLFIK